jgi:hypothetical protein
MIQVIKMYMKMGTIGMNKLIVGEKYYLCDHSYSMEIVDGQISSGSGWLIRGEYDIVEVVAHGGLVLPTGISCCRDKVEANNTIVRRIADGKIIFVQDRFIKDLSRPNRVNQGYWDLYRKFDEYCLK